MELNYKNVNGYLLPELGYKSGEQMLHIGKYGFLRRDYLKNCKRAKYQVMLLQDTIGQHLLEIDRAAKEREEIILKPVLTWKSFSLSMVSDTLQLTMVMTLIRTTIWE